MRTRGTNVSAAPAQRWVLALASVAALMVGLDMLVVTTALTAIHLPQMEQAAPSADQAAELADAGQRELADRYVSAFVSADMVTLTRLLADEVILEMPPFLTWFRGRARVARFLSARALAAPDRWRVIRVGANGQPAAGAYLRQDDGRHHTHSVQVFRATGEGITWIAAFQEPGVFETFGLPPVYPR